MEQEFQPSLNRDVNGTLCDPVGYARWYAEKRVIFIEARLEKARERVAALEAEMLEAQAQLDAIEAGVVEPVIPDERLNKDAAQTVRGIRQGCELSLDHERDCINAALVASGLFDRGWMVTDAKVDDFAEYLTLTRLHKVKRKCCDAKAVAKALRIGIDTNAEARQRGASADDAGALACAAFDEALTDESFNAAYDTIPLQLVVDRARLLKPVDDFGMRQDHANAAHLAFMAVVDTKHSTGPP